MEGDSSLAVWRAANLAVGIANSIKYGISWLSSGLAIGDGDDENGLAHLLAAELVQNDAVNDLLPELSAHGSESTEFVSAKQLLDLLLASDSGCQVVRGVLVHEAEVNSIIVEEGSSKGNPLQNKLQVLDALSLLFKLHGTTVVNVDDNVVERQFDNVIANLLLNAPCLAEAIDL